MFHDILSRHGDKFVGAALFPPLPRGAFKRSLERVLRFDGAAGLWRLAHHMMEHRWRAYTASPPHYPSIGALFARFGIPFHWARRPNDAEFLAHVEAARPDIVFNNQPWFLSPPFLEIPGVVCINRHTGLLPHYRGIEPVVHALLAGDNQIGVTYHTMTAEYDAGRILAQTKVPAAPSVFECYRRTFAASGPLFDRALAALDDLEACPLIEPDPEEYCHEPTTEQIRAFRHAGFRYL